MKRKGVIIAIIVVLIVAVGVGIAIFLVNKNNNTDEPTKTNNYGKITNIEGKIKEYLSGLGNNYAIKYSGKFEDNSGERITALVEYTKDMDNYAIKSNELDLYIVYEEGKARSISNRYKMVAKIPASGIDITKYNYVSDFGQEYVRTYDEEIEDKYYQVEEYKKDEDVIKYYFLDSEIKIIKYNDETIRVIRVEKKTNRELFEVPNGYKEV